MGLNFENLHPDFGARCGGAELAGEISDDLRDEIASAIEQFGVVYFPGQNLDQDSQIALARRFGELDRGFNKVSKAPSRFKHAELLDMSNVGADGEITSRDHKKIVGNIANQLWHSDSSFQKPGSAFSLLYAVTLPSHGGETEFADCRVAYETLSDETKEMLDGLVARHDALHSRMQLGDDQYTPEQRAAMPAVEWPVVREQTATGRASLFIGAHVCEIVGMTLPEGRMLLMDLLEHATTPERVYRHHWRLGDLVIWDNRITLHRGRKFDYAERRELRRTTTLVPAA